MRGRVKYLGFDSRPELLDRLERLVPDLEGEVGRWANRVGVVFELKQQGAEKPFVRLTLSLTLPNVSGEESGVAAFEDIDDSGRFRKWVRFLWGNLLDKLLNQRAEQTEKEMAESLGG